MAGHDTLAAACRHQEEVRKSRFLAQAGPAGDVAAAMRFIESRSQADATHNCWAYRVGNEYRYSDAGEPGGTAGRPILQAIDGQGYDRVAVVVARWFGGIKLGTGGLMRAYGGCAANCLRAGARVPWVETVRVRCACSHADRARLAGRLAGHGAEVLEESFGPEGAVLELAVPRPALEPLAAELADLSRGKASWQVRED